MIMIQPHKTLSSVGVALSMAVFVGGAIATGAIAASNARSSAIVFPVSFALGCILWIWGCYHHAKAKGYSGWMAIFGLFSLPGLIVLLILPDRTPR